MGRGCDQGNRLYSQSPEDIQEVLDQNHGHSVLGGSSHDTQCAEKPDKETCKTHPGQETHLCLPWSPLSFVMCTIAVQQ